MPRKRSLSAKRRSLKRELHGWFEKNDLAEDTFWLPPPVAEPLRPTPDLVLVFEGDLHSVLWVRPFEDHDSAYSGRLRLEFDAVVKKHGFFFQFKDEVTGHLYEREE